MTEKKKSKFFDSGALRELVFGMEDGMVSTMGAITGIAVGSGNHTIVLLSGAVIIAVESISMGVGSYLSNKSEQAMEEKEVADLRARIQQKKEIGPSDVQQIFEAEGWSSSVAQSMTTEALQNPALLSNELSYRTLGIAHHKEEHPLKNGVIMLGAYVIGGLVPLSPYIFASGTDVGRMIPVSVGLTLVGLFSLGAYITKFSLRKWWKGGFEMLILAGVAGAVGYIVGQYFGAV